jgi:hypothetical protein
VREVPFPEILFIFVLAILPFWPRLGGRTSRQRAIDFSMAIRQLVWKYTLRQHRLRISDADLIGLVNLGLLWMLLLVELQWLSSTF